MRTSAPQTLLAWSPRMRSAPRWNGSVSVATRCGVGLGLAIVESIVGAHDGAFVIVPLEAGDCA